MSGRRTHGGSAGGGRRGPGGGLQFQRQEPSFLRKLKEQVGFREAVPTLDDKNPNLAPEDGNEGNDEDRPDERPTVVVLKEGDLTEEEAKVEEDKAKMDVEKGGKILFRKPEKRKIEDTKVENNTEKSRSTKREDESSRKKVQKAQKNLLSFNEDEDDE